MPRPICMKCSREMTNLRPAVVQFNARVTSGPYEQWHGDLYSCKDCGAEIVVGFAQKPSWRHHERPSEMEEPAVVVEEPGYRGQRAGAPPEIR